MSIATLIGLAAGAKAASGIKVQPAPGGRPGTAQRGRSAPPQRPHHQPAPAPKPKPQPKTNNKPLTTNNKSPLAPNIQPRAPISDEQIKSADEFFKLIDPSVSVTKDAKGKTTLKISNKLVDITGGITKDKLKEAGLNNISDNLFTAIAKRSKLDTEMSDAQKAAADPNNISFEELNIFLEENLKEFANMQGATDLKALFNVYNNAKGFVRASDADKQELDKNSFSLKQTIQAPPTASQQQTEVKTKWDTVHAKTAEYLGVDPAKSHLLVGYAADHLGISQNQDISDYDLERLTKFISFLPWLMKNMPDTAKNSDYYKLPNWLKNQQGPDKLAEKENKEWYQKVLGKKVQTAVEERAEEKSQQAKLDDDISGGRSTDKSADILKGTPA